MTDVADTAAARGGAPMDLRVLRAQALRQRQLNSAAVARVAPDATAGERTALLELMSQSEDQPRIDPPDLNRVGARGRLRGRPWRRRGAASPAPAGPSSSATADSAIPVELATIPKPGRSSRPVGHSRSWVTRALVVTAPLILIGGVAYSQGVGVGSARVVTPGVLTAPEADRFHLSTFPAAQASGFAAAYLTLCLTHPDPADKIAVANRLAGLAQMASAGVAPGCGWKGTSAEPAPLAVTWNGAAIAIPAYTAGAAASLGFTVTTADGRTTEATVPVWVSSTGTAQAMRVTGDVTVLPAVAATPAPTPIAPAVTDASLATAVTPTVLLPFLRAWGASDSIQLGLVLAPSATADARTGLNGYLQHPTIVSARVIVDSGSPDDYLDGDQVTATVTVDWTTATNAVQRTGYSVVLQRVSGRWRVTDITNAAPDPAGGAAPSATFPTTPASTAPGPPPAGSAG